MGHRLAQGLQNVPGATLRHPAQANILFPDFTPGTNARATEQGAVYYNWTTPDHRDAARFVASWSTTEQDVDSLISALKP